MHSYVAALEVRCERLETLCVEQSIWVPRWVCSQDGHAWDYTNGVCIYGYVNDLMCDENTYRAGHITKGHSAVHQFVTNIYANIETAKEWVEREVMKEFVCK
jgi:hypothetical protein